MHFDGLDYHSAAQKLEIFNSFFVLKVNNMEIKPILVYSDKSIRKTSTCSNNKLKKESTRNICLHYTTHEPHHIAMGSITKQII